MKKSYPLIQLSRLYILMLAIVLPFFAGAKTIYITVTGAGNHNGLSWANACSLAEAAFNDPNFTGGALAKCGDELWLAKGKYDSHHFVYVTTTGNSQSGHLFDSYDGLDFNGDVYGGFAGNETSRSQRNPALNPVSISNVNNLGYNNGITTHTCSAASLNIDGIDFENDAMDQSVLVNYTNCTFQLFSLQSDNGSGLTAINCTFKNGPWLNLGIYLIGRFTNCTFRNLTNTSGGGNGGGAVQGDNIQFHNCIFDNNYSTGPGGALQGSGNMVVENCLFTNNGSGDLAGAIMLDGANSKIYMNTFYNNNAYGSIINNVSANSIEDYRGGNTIANNIMWGSNGGTAVQFYNEQGGSYSPDNFSSNITNDGTANGISSDPQFNSNFTLKACSPAINAGDNNYTDGQSLDLGGNTRTKFGTVDIGCFEFQTGNYVAAVLSASTLISCPGAPITLTVAGAGYAQFNWYGSDTSAVTTYPYLNIDPYHSSSYTVYVTAQGCTAISNTINVQINAAPVAPALVSQSPTNFVVCAGQNVSATCDAGSGGGAGCTGQFRYSIDGGNTWLAYTNGANINTTNAVGVVFVESRRGGCSNCPSSQWSIVADWGVNPVYTPAVVINGPVSVLQGQTATFSANVTNGGTSPSYQWSRNGVNVGTNSSTYTDNSPANNETVACTVTSNATVCLSTTTASASVPLLVYSLNITDPTNCNGSTLTANFNVIPAALNWDYYNGYLVLGTSYPTWNPTGTVVAGAHGNGAGLNQLANPRGIVTDALGNIYVAEQDNNRVVKWAPGATTGTVVAGGNGAGGGANQLSGPTALCIDGSANLYILDRSNNRVQRWNAGATSGTTVAGGHGGGSATNQLGSGFGMALTPSGNLYITDVDNSRVMLWRPNATAGILVAGGNGQFSSSANGFSSPTGICVDTKGTVDTLYVADFGNNRVQKWAVGATSGVTVAGGNGGGSAANQLREIYCLYLDAAGNLYVPDYVNDRLQLWRPGATTGITIAGGNGAGTGSNQFAGVQGICIDASGNIYIADVGYTNTAVWGRVQKFTPVFTDKSFVTIYGGPMNAQTIGFDGTVLKSNVINIIDVLPPAVSISPSALEICPGGYVTFTPAPNYGGTAPIYQWYVNSTLKATTTGNYVTNTLNVNDVVYCVMTSNEPCASITTATSNSVIMQPYVVSVSIEALPSYSVCAGTPVTFSAFAVNGGGTPGYKWLVNGIQKSTASMFTSATLNNDDAVSLILTSSTGCTNTPAATSTPIVMQVATDHLTSSGVCVGSLLTTNVPATPAVLQWYRNDTLISTVNPSWNQNATTVLQSNATTSFVGKSLFVDAAENIYITDFSYSTGNPRVLKFVPGDSVGIVVAGGNGQGYSSNQLIQPVGIFVDSAQNVYVADDFTVSKWAGGSKAFYAGFGNSLNNASDVWLDHTGNIFVIDDNDNRVVEYPVGTPNGTSLPGLVVAGGNGVGSGSNQLNAQTGLYVDDSDNVYVADWYNDRIQKWPIGATAGITVAGGNGHGTAANQTPYPKGIFVDKAGNMFIQDNDDRIQLWPAGASSGITIVGGNGSGSAANQINPVDFSVNAKGDIYVLDATNNRVQKFTVAGILDTLTATAAGRYTTRAISFGGCHLTSNTDTIKFVPSPSVSISASPGNTVCPSTVVTFTAQPVNGGTNPSYQWFVNNVLVQQSTGSTYTSAVLQNSDQINCIITSSTVCANTPTATSNTISMTVQTPDIAAVSISSDLASVCAGSIATLTATAINGGTSPVYKWYRDSVLVKAGVSPVYVDTVTLGDNIVCIMISNDNCALHTGVASNQVKLADVIAPVATTKNITIALDANGNASISPSQVDNGSVDNCGGAVSLSLFGGAVGSSCLTLNENTNGLIGCPPGMMFTSVDFASYGTPTGTCNSFGLGSCNATTSQAVIQQALLGNRLVPVSAKNSIFGDPCAGTAKHLSIQAGYSPNTPLTSFNCSNIGVNNVVLFVTDASGNISSAKATVTIIDNMAPIITVPAAITLSTDANLCTSGASIGTATATDNCSTVTITHTPSGPYPTGITSVTWTATDGSNNISTGTQAVTVNDNQAPTAVCQNLTVQLDANHQASVSAAQINNGSYDNCGPVSLSISTGQTSFSCNDLGQTFPVTLLVTDGNNNTSSCTAYVTVAADVYPCCAAPNAVCKSATVQLDASGNGILAATDVDGGSTTDCGLRSLIVSPNTFTCSNKGINIVALTITDIKGNFSSCHAVVTVVDTVAPVITVPSAVSLNTDPGQCSSGASIGTATATDNCLGTTIAYAPAGPYAKGTTTVTWTATDASGNSASGTQAVTVVDHESPIITVPGAVTINTDPGQCSSSASIGTATATDNCPGVIVSHNPAGPYAKGTTTISWTATDANGNTATGTQAVTVVDHESPVITVPGAVTINTDPGQCSSSASIGTATATDNCPGVIVSHNPAGPYAKGTTTISWTATDANGNKATGTQAVTVVDHESPVITVPGAVTINADPGQCSSSASIGTATATDNCPGVTVSHNPAGPYAKGTTTVTWTATDANGNTASGTQAVTVVDHESPVITVPGAVTINTDPGQCSSGASIGTATATDNCPGVTVSHSPSGPYATGTTTVTWTATDASGNRTSRTQSVTVTDNQAPTITCPAGIAITANASTCNKPLTISIPVTHDNCGVASAINNFNNTANASGTYPVGVTNVLWTVTDVHGLTNTCTQTVTIYHCIQVSGTAANTICIGTSNGSVNISVSGGTAPYTYLWSNGKTTANISGLSAGNYTVTVNDATSGSATAVFAVGTTVPASKPAVPGPISGIAKFCIAVTNTYSVTPVPYATSYTWTVPSNSTILSGSGTSQITVRFQNGFNNGTIRVTASNCKGTSSQSILQVSLFDFPDRPAYISGSTAICAGDVVTYTAASVTDATSYTWTIPAHTVVQSGQGTSQLTVQYQTGFTGGNVSVYASNCLGNGSSRSVSIGLKQVPGSPSNISGASKACTSVTYQYQISAVNNATSYHWTVPANALLISGQGNTSITVQFVSGFTNGNISVYAIDCAGNGPSVSKQVSHTTSGCGSSKMDEGDNGQSAEAAQTEFKINVYPNPFSDQFHLRVEGAGDGKIYLNIYNLEGQQITAEKEAQAYQSDISFGDELSSGMYIIRVQQGDNIKVLRIVKSK